MIKAGIYGATGYTGIELVRLLARHPGVELLFVTSESKAGRPLSTIFPQAPAHELVAAAEAPLAEVDLVFLCLPHAAAAQTAVSALNAGKRVIDLSADFRLKERAVYEEWYKVTHPAPDWLETAVYGLTEFSRPALAQAQLVANPGCYPTSILLGLQPLLAAGLPISGPIIADSKSGVSGAGRAPKQHTHFVEIADNFSPYGIGRGHRHLPEIEQQIRAWQPDAPPLIFSPHLLPVPRGILSTIYVNFESVSSKKLVVSNGMAEVRTLYEAAYGDEPFVDVLPEGELATLAHVVHSNRCVIGLTPAGSTLIITSAIDNLVKGAAGQAVQNMNVMYGLEEEMGLEG
ncbi:MAG: N-acetyl-gamma-glutamyl-phosphate reductase [Chloroflexota bacterium]